MPFVMIWEIDIKGAKPETEHQMVKHLEEIGVKKGRLQFLMMLDKRNNITKNITNPAVKPRFNFDLRSRKGRPFLCDIFCYIVSFIQHDLGN
jgi:hypothetical protein